MYLLELISTDHIIIRNIFYTLAIVVIFYGVNRYTVHRILKKEQDAVKVFTAKKVAKSLFGVLFVIILLVIWYDSKDNILAFFGLFTAGMAIAMKDIIINMIGALYIMWAAPFKIGDRIEIAGQIGDVIDVRAMEFSMLEVGNRISGEQSTGRILHIPNMYVFNHALANYEKGFKFIWNELCIPLDQKSDWEKAKTFIYALLEEHTKPIIEDAKAEIDEAGKNYLIYYNNLTPMIYTEVKEQQIILSIRYLCEPRKLRTTEHMLWEAILKMIKEHDDIML